MIPTTRRWYAFRLGAGTGLLNSNRGGVATIPDSIIVYSIIAISLNGANMIINIEDKNSNVLFEIPVGSVAATAHVQVPFVASNGLQLRGPQFAAVGVLFRPEANTNNEPNHFE